MPFEDLYFENFSYLCIVKQNSNNLTPFAHASKSQISTHNPHPSPPSAALGRSELAQRYFPSMLQKSAWQKLKSWLQVNPRLTHLAHLSRRTFTPAELGEP